MAEEKEKKEDKRKITAPENGKLGGRPKSEATLRAQFARDYISKQVEDSLAPIVARAITQAITGDDKARDWLSDRAWGKAIQATYLSDDDGNPLEVDPETAKMVNAALAKYLGTKRDTTK